MLLLLACALSVDPGPPAAPVDLPAPVVETPPAFQGTGPASPRLDGPVPADTGGARTVSFLQTDKPVYRPGETIWVVSRRLDADLHPAGADTPARAGLVLLDPAGATAQGKRVEERQGFATNDLTLPESAPGGLWKVRVDLPDGTHSEREIVVVGHELPRVQKTLDFLRKLYVPGDTVVATVAVKGPDGEPLVDHPLDARIRVGGLDLPAQGVRTDGAGMALVRFTLPAEVGSDDSLLTVLVEDGGLTESIARRIPVDREGLSVRLFPEGGTLVAGLPSRVYFAASRADGKPGDVSGVVVDDRGRVITPFTSFHHGLGRFSLTPEPGRGYHLQVRGSARTVDLPAPSAEGCVLTTPDDFASTLPQVRAEVRCTTPQDVSLVLSRRGRRLDAARVAVPVDAAARVFLEAGPPAAGAVRVTLADAEGRPLAERAVFRDRDQQLRVHVQPRGEDFGPRDAVTLDVTTTDPAGRPVAADLSLVVVDEAVLSWADDKQGDLVSGVLLEAEVPGRVEDPLSFFAEPTGYALDLLLGTAGFRSFQVPDPHDTPDPGWTPPEAAREPARAGRPEARVGKRDAWMERARGDRRVALDREIAEQAGVLGALRAEAAPGALGDDAAWAGLIGAPPVGLGGPEGLGQGFPDAGARDGWEGGQRIGGRGGGVRTDSPIVLGALDRGLIEQVIQHNLAQIRYCHQRELAKHPDLAGRLTVKFVIDRDGSVRSATAKVSTLPEPAVERCVLSRFLRFRFPAPKGGGVVIVSYPFRFAAGDGGEGADAEVSPVRRFPAPPILGEARTDFRETIAWIPSLRTDTRGKATARVTLSDAVTRFRVTVQGVGGGRVGRSDAPIVSRLPFSLAVKLPAAAAIGDHLRVPLTLTNTRDTPLRVQVTGSLGPPRTVRLPARGAQTVSYPLAVTGPTSVRVSAEADGLVDGVERTLKVVDPGFPRTWAASGRLDGTLSHTLTVDDPRGDGATAWISAYPNVLPTLTEGLEGLLDLPVGCFEQASSANYPNLLVLQLLEHGSGDAATVARARTLLGEGYRRLVGFESRGGGYEWFGGFPAHGALSAYGLLEFTQMKGVFEDVDAGMLARTRAWLLARRDGNGGWREDDRALDSFGRASPEVADAYILWALVQAGAAAELETELAAAAADPPLADAYRLALITDALAGPRPGVAAPLAEHLAALQEPDGAWRRADHSITRSGGRNLVIETTALATRALLDLGGHTDAVDAGIRWLLSQREASGRWGSTQGTVLTLDVLTRYANTTRAVGPGSAEVRVDEVAVGTLRWEPGRPTPRLLLPIGNGTHTVTVVAEGSPVPYTLGARWSTRSPPDTTRVLAVDTTLSDTTPSLGAPVRLTATVRHPSAEPLGMVVAAIGLPAGLEPQTWQLRELVDTGVVDFYETRDAQVFLYWRAMEGGRTHTVPLDLLAVVPGTSTAPASSAWVYYDDDQKAWAAPLPVTVDGG